MTDFPTEHDAEVAQKLLDKCQAIKDRVAKLVHDELDAIVSYEDMLSYFPAVAEAVDELTYKERKQAKAVIGLYESKEKLKHERQESTFYTAYEGRYA